MNPFVRAFVVSDNRLFTSRSGEVAFESQCAESERDHTGCFLPGYLYQRIAIFRKKDQDYGAARHLSTHGTRACSRRGMQ
jgi:hypothetical protein